MNLECVPHASRQGQRKKRIKHIHEDGMQQSEDLNIIDEVTGGSSHYGVHYLIRSWLSFAFTRRSFSLLSRAGKLAAACGIEMDDLLNTMSFLPPLLLLPKNEQEISGPPLSWEEIPSTFLTAIGCEHNISIAPKYREHRWIWIREMKNGASRYLLTESLQRDFVSHAVVQETWVNNTKPVVDLFLDGDEQRSKHTKAFAHQVSLHSESNRTPECSRLSHVRVKTPSDTVVDCDQVSSLIIQSLDHAFYYVEYIPRENETSQSFPKKRKAEDQSLISNLDLDLPFVNLDDLTEDKEYEVFLAILEDNY